MCSCDFYLLLGIGTPPFMAPPPPPTDDEDAVPSDRKVDWGAESVSISSLRSE